MDPPSISCARANSLASGAGRSLATFAFFPVTAPVGCGRDCVAAMGKCACFMGGDGGALERARLAERSVESDWKRLMTRCAPLIGLEGATLGDGGGGAREYSGGVKGVLGRLTKIDVYPTAVRSGLKFWMDGVILLAVVGVSMKFRKDPEG